MDETRRWKLDQWDCKFIPSLFKINLTSIYKSFDYTLNFKIISVSFYTLSAIPQVNDERLSRKIMAISSRWNWLCFYWLTLAYWNACPLNDVELIEINGSLKGLHPVNKSHERELSNSTNPVRGAIFFSWIANVAFQRPSCSLLFFKITSVTQLGSDVL